MNPNVERRIYWLFVLSFLAVSGVGTTAYLQVRSYDETAQKLLEWHRFISSSNRLNLLYQSILGTQRAYVASGDAPLLEAYRASRAQLDDALRLLREDIPADMRDPAPERQIEAMILRRIEASDRAVKLQTSGDHAAALAIVNDSGVLDLTQEIRKRFEALSNFDDRNHQDMENRIEQLGQRNVTVIGIGLALDLALLGLALGLIHVELSRRREAEAGLRAARDELERRVEERTANLQRVSATLHAIIEACPQPIVCVDAEGRARTAWNPAAERVFGWRPAEVLGKPLPIIAGGADEEFARLRRRIREDGAPANLEMRLIRKDGTGLDASISSAPLRDAAGQVGEILAVISDVTERNRAQRALAASERRYRTFFEEDLTGDSITLPDGTLIDCNRAFLRIFGFESVEQARSWNFARLYIHPEERASTTERLRKERTLEQMEATFLRKDGKLIDLIFNMFGVFDERGELEQINTYFFDITERKLMEEQLRQKHKMEAVGHLAGGIAHDFNNLLTVINGYAELLLARIGPGDAQRPEIVEILRAGEQAAVLTSQLLAFSRKQMLQPRIIDLNGIVSGMNKMLQRLIGGHIAFTALTDESLGAVRADPSQMEQVIMNLVLNARDAMPAGGKLLIETSNVTLDEAYTSRHAVVAPGEYVMLAISDTGLGMDEETKAQIFEPFFTTKDKGKGTGLGLSTVYGIIRQTGGNIWVYSEPGKGTTFKIYLPRMAAAPQPLAPPAPAPAAPPAVRETILLVEDEPALRTMGRQILTRQGYHVLDAPNGPDAIEMYRARGETVHLVVTDVVMPVMSGQAMIEHLATMIPNLKVLYMSGYTENAIVHHGVVDAEKDFIGKPFTPKAFLAKVREILDRPIKAADQV